METTHETTEENRNACPPLTRQQYPWLVMAHESHIFFSLVEDHLYIRSIPDMANKFINCCHRGWLVLVDQTDQYHDCSILDLVSMKKVELPTLKFTGHHICVISSPPTDTNFRVVFIRHAGDYFFSYQLGEQEFRQQQLITETEDDKVIIDAINFDGKVYGITYPSYTLVSADFADPDLRFRRLIRDESLPNMLSHPSAKDLCCLVESCGELLYIHNTYHGSQPVNFQIFRADFSTKSWVKLQSIGDRAIFLDQWRGASSPATDQCGIKGNTIYFTRHKDRNLYVCDLEDQCISMTLPNPDVDSSKSLFYWILIPFERNS